MTAPTRSFTEIAKVGQASVAAAVRIWADLAQASVKVITTGQSELLDGRRVADFVFGIANQMLDGQRALLSAVTTSSASGHFAVAEIAEVTAANNGAVVEIAAKAAAETVETAAEVEKATVETASEKAAETTQAAAKTVETAAESEKAAAETVSTRVAEKPKVVEGPYGAGSHAPLADRSKVPAGFAIKGNDGSKLYHVPGSPFYKRTIAEVWFASSEAAEAAGFQRPASQR